MAPRAPESKAQFLARLQKQAASLATRPVGLGSPHHSHAVVHEEGVFRVRRLVLPKAKVEAWVKEHKSFMPEHAEMLSEPTGEIVLEAPTLAELISRLESMKWPL
jgi:hypothetical protein